MERAEHQVARHRRPDRNVRRLHIANLAHHDHVRVLPQNVAEPFRECQVDLRFHIDLRHTRQPIFHRLFDRDDPALDRIDAAEETIERRRFPAARRPGQQNDSVRLREQRPDDLALLLAHVEPVEPEMLGLGAAQQAQADRLAVHGRDR